ncbi:MAG: DUF711 family protein [Chloroflexota bacterium]
MNIRAITLFSPLNWPFDLKAIQSASRFLKIAKKQIEAAGYTVQTIRLATPPFMDLIGDPDPFALQEFAVMLEEHTRQNGVDSVSIGPIMATTPRSMLAPIYAIPEIIKSTETVYCSTLVSSAQRGINLAAIEATAKAIHTIGQQTPMGLGNLRFAMLANVPPGTPVFPGAYHNRSTPAFGIVTEAAETVTLALQNASSLEQAQKNLITGLNTETKKLMDVISDLIDEHNISFSGIDLSLIPASSDQTSVAAAVEHLGVPAFGAPGSLFALSVITNAIRQANLPITGYSGIMLSILKDKVLAQRIVDQQITITDLLLTLAVNSTGLDAIPIPGDATPDQISCLLLDVATLSTTLNKPFQARLLPLPGLKAGDMTSFTQDDLVNSTVLPLKEATSKDLFRKSIFYNPLKKQ